MPSFSNNPLATLLHRILHQIVDPLVVAEHPSPSPPQ
uniref:Uncharacterized protein n=1 Tax=Arundo donax TaxID=35708 RepID=A0A0A9HAN9_ARUDO